MMLPNMEVFGLLVKEIHSYLTTYFYLAMPIAILFSVCFGFLKSGNPNYPDIIKRAVVAGLLLATFPEVSNLILDICDGLAAKIDSLGGLEMFIKMAEQRSRYLSNSAVGFPLKFEDLLISILSFGSYVLLLVARILSIVMYYFFWILLSALSPLLILCYMFPATSGITVNLYRGLIEVACWKILWAVMSAMLASLSFGDAYKADGQYLTMIVMNFVIAIAMVRTPVVMKSIIGSGVQGLAQDLGTSAAMAAISLPVKVMNVKAAAMNPGGFISSQIKNYKSPKGGKR